MQENTSLFLPYPKLSGEITNSELNNLYDLYAGRFSELTSITTYIYQAVITQGRDISETLHRISITEMKHLELLANAIMFFGGDPVFAGKYNYFSCSYTNYCKDIREFLITDIQWELSAQKDYKNFALKTQNASLAELLTRLSMDEELHVCSLTRAYVSIFSEEPNL